MPNFQFKLPDIGEGVAEGEIVGWLAEEGDTVEENQDLVEVMTDKATVTIGSPKRGRVLELKGPPGTMVPVGQVLAVLEVADSTDDVVEPGQPQETPQSSETSPSAVGDLKDHLPGVTPQPAMPAIPAEAASFTVSVTTSQSAPPGRPVAAPATRRLARELGVNLLDIGPSGAGERITREDVERYAALQTQALAAAEQAVTLVPQPRVLTPPARGAFSPTPPDERRGEQRVPIRGLRKRIYDNMARAKRTAAHFTYMDECEVTELTALRDRLKPLAETEKVRLSFLPFVVKAAVVALKRHPALNCLVDDVSQEMVLRESCDIGIATATEAGLIVPVLRRAEQLSLLEIAREIDRMASLAREGKTRPDDLGGSSFTITSLGKLGGLMATPVVNYPEVAILGVHEIRRRPVVRADSIVIGKVMGLSLSFDHRIIDGHVGALFAQEIKACLEQPDRLFLTMG
ncbi:dihydrolipoamide acetyltransferase family protein [Myxococcota bacterium]